MISQSTIADDDNNRLSVISGYDGTQRYAEYAAEKDGDERVSLYQNYVSDPYIDICSGSGEQFAMSRKFLNTPIQNTDDLLASISSIKEFDVRSRVTHWISLAQEKLPLQALTVCIFPYSPDEPFVDRIKRELSGNMGFVETGGVLWTQFVPADGWLDTLPHMVLHEYHHAARYLLLPNLAERQTLLETLVTEGTAEVFALTIRPEGPSKPFPPLSEKDQARVWAEMQEHLDSFEPKDLQLFVFGDGERIPRLAGYVIGREIASSFIRNNPDVPITEWSAMAAREFLDLSGYSPGK